VKLDFFAVSGVPADSPMLRVVTRLWSPGPRHEPAVAVWGLNGLDEDTPMKSKLKTGNNSVTLAVLLACLLFLLSPAWPAGESDQKAALSESEKGRVSTKALTQVSTGPLTRPSKGEYVIGPEDVLAINVWKEPEISRSVPVRPDGKISLPLVGDLLASGLTTDKLRDNIAAKLKEYISNPEVIVIVQEVKSRSFNIVGKVGKPGSYDLAKPMTVLDALAVAGGFQDFAKSGKIYVLRRETDGSRKMLPFNYKLVIKGRGLDQNVELQSGDTVVVP
jgi:polysaccharide biosynthesis/export protein